MFLSFLMFGNRDLFTASTCDLLSHDAYFLSLYLPQCSEYLDALLEYAGNLNPCEHTSSYDCLSLHLTSILLDALEFPVCTKQVQSVQSQEKEGNWNDETNWTKYPK